MKEAFPARKLGDVYFPLIWGPHCNFATVKQHLLVCASEGPTVHTKSVQVPHGPLKQRNEANKKVEDLLKDNAGKDFAERKLLYRMQYRPKDGMFCKMPADLMLGNFIPEEQSTDGQMDDSQRFSYMGTDYGAGCFVYMMPEYATLPCLCASFLLF